MSEDRDLTTTALAVAVAVIEAVLSTGRAGDPDVLKSLRKDMERLLVKRCRGESLLDSQQNARLLVVAARNGQPY